MFPSQSDIYTPLVQRFMRIEDVTWGAEKQHFLVRYRGQVLGDSSEAYDRLAEYLRPSDVTPLFRNEAGRHVIVLVKGVVRPRPSNPWVNLLLIMLTLFSVLFVGTLLHYDGPLSGDLTQLLPRLLPALEQGLAYGLSLIVVLLAHEFGHYLAGRYHQTTVTLPYFIPFPLPPFGTLGAFIQLKETPKNRRILLDIGIAGPLCGLLVTIPILLLGLSLSPLDRLPLTTTPMQGLSMEGNSLLYLLLKYLVFGKWLPQPLSYGGMVPILYWIRYLFTAAPLPLGGTDVMLHPVAYAGWVGLLVTGLNLIPAGQLDGGHLLYVLVGQNARRILPWIILALLALGMIWSGWWLWAFLAFMFGRVHAEPLDQITPLDPRRRAIAILGLILFIFVFTPVPMSIFGM
jgi:membrane-associated protease RseP (regulator of RpoE activity)